jgi:hypothetical protein
MIRRTLREQADFIRSTIEAMGHKINPVSRIGRMHTVVCRPRGEGQGVITPDDKHFPIAREALKDLQMISHIFDNLESGVDLLLHAKVRRLIKDSVLPENDAEESQGRDAQHELFVAATAAAARLTPRLAEPDVLASIGGLEFAIAAKRIKSLDNLENNVRGAAKQIEECGRPGLIAIDIALAMHPSNEPIMKRVSPQLFEWAAQKMESEFRKRYEAMIIGICRGKEVRGLIVHDHHVFPELSGTWGLSGYHFPISCSKGNQRRDREFGKIYNGYLKGLPNRHNVAQSK